MKLCRLLCIIASIEYIRRQIEELFTSCIKGLIRKFTEIHILIIQSGVNKRNKNRGEHSVVKHQFSIHSYIPVIIKYHVKQMQVVYDQTYSTFSFKASREPHKCVEKVLFMCRNGHFVFSNFLPLNVFRIGLLSRITLIGSRIGLQFLSSVEGIFAIVEIQ